MNYSDSCENGINCSIDLHDHWNEKHVTFFSPSFNFLSVCWIFIWTYLFLLTLLIFRLIIIWVLFSLATFFSTWIMDVAYLCILHFCELHFVNTDVSQTGPHLREIYNIHTYFDFFTYWFQMCWSQSTLKYCSHREFTRDTLSDSNDSYDFFKKSENVKLFHPLSSRNLIFIKFSSICW